LETVFVDQQETIGTQASTEALKAKRSAFIFITADSELSRIALDDLRKISGVEEVYLSRGAYDLVAKVNGDSLEYIREYILKQIRRINSVKSTLTLTIV
jgi:DNA-binding Lrp family transcriptional regulator